MRYIPGRIVVFILLFPFQLLAQKTRLTVPTGHLNTPRSIAVSPNGKWMASTDYNHIIIWNAINGSQLKTLTLQKSIESISWFPDNLTLAVQEEDYPVDTIFKLNIQTAERLGMAVVDDVYRMRVSHDGKYILLSGKGNIRVMDAATMQVVQTIEADNKNLQLTIYTSPDEKYCAAVSFKKISVNNLSPGEGTTKKTGKKVFDIKPPFGEILRYQFSPDGKSLITLVGPDFGMVCFDIATENVKWSVRSNDKSFDDFGFTADGKYIITLHEDAIEMYDLATGNKTGKSIPMEKGYGTDMIVSGGMAYIWDEWHSEYRITRYNPLTASRDISFKGDYQDGYHAGIANAAPVFAQYGSKSPLRIWNFKEGRNIQSFYMGEKFKGFGFSPDGNTVAYGKPFTIRDTRTGNEKARLPYDEFYAPDGVSISAKEKYICAWENGENNVMMFDVDEKTLLWKKDNLKPNGSAFSPDENLIAISYENGAIEIYESSTGTIRSSFMAPDGSNFKPAGIAFKTNNELVTGCGKSIQSFNAATGALIKNYFTLSGSNNPYMINFQLGDDGKTALLETRKTNGFASIVNLETGNITSTITNENNGFYFAGLVTGNRFVVTVDVNDITSVWDAASGKKILDLFSYNDEWLAVTPDGRFDGSQDAINKLYFTKGTETIPLQNLYEHYYTPHLISRLFNGEQLEPVADIDNISDAPTVKIYYKQATRNLFVSDDITSYDNTTGTAEIIIKASCAGDKIDEIRLYHNGKAVSSAARNLVVDNNNSNTVNNAEKKFEINLLPGENIFRATALNTQRTESNPDVISVVYQQSNTNNQPANNTIYEAPIATVDRNATLHLLVVGINAYDNASMKLNYALADASSFKDEVEKNAKQMVGNIKTYFITDKQADKTTIATAFQNIQRNAKSQDVFVFYYAGHGVVSNKEFYLVPRDVSDLKNVQDELNSKGISATQLQQYAIDIAAQKQAFILDACQSAGAFANMLNAEAGQQRSLALLARSTGTHWIAASGSQQFANEFDALGHGAFTFVLLEALKGGALLNNMVTVNGLKNYLQKAVPELMKKYRGTTQYPSSYGFGNDFPVEVKE